MRLFRKGPSKLDEAMGRIQLEPPRIHNPAKGTRSHYRDPGQAAARPLCNASGNAWAEGDGGLQLCALCRGWGTGSSDGTEAA